MAEERMVNGVNVGGLFAMIDEIKQRPAVASYRLRAHNQWIDGTHCRTTVRDFYGAGEERAHRRAFVLDADEPEVLLGHDEGPNATEAALHALASCLNATFIYHASAHGVRVRELEIELEGDLDLRGVFGLSEEVRNGFSQIRATFRVKADAPREKIEELCRLAQKRSPVFDIVTHATPVEARVEIG